MFDPRYEVTNYLLKHTCWVNRPENMKIILYSKKFLVTVINVTAIFYENLYKIRKSKYALTRFVEITFCSISLNFLHKCHKMGNHQNESVLILTRRVKIIGDIWHHWQSTQHINENSEQQDIMEKWEKWSFQLTDTNNVYSTLNSEELDLL